MASLPPLRQAMEAAATGPVLVLDTGEMSFADSSALNLLLLMHQTTTLRIAAPPHQLIAASLRAFRPHSASQDGATLRTARQLPQNNVGSVLPCGVC